MRKLKKRGAALLLALALTLGPAVPALAAEPAGKALAYTTDKILWVGPIPLAGLVVVNGEYYVPMEILNARNTNGQCLLPLSFQEYAFSGGVDGRYTLMQDYGTYVSRWADNKATAVKPVMCTIPGLELGTVTTSKIPVNVIDTRSYPHQAHAIPSSAVYDLDGHYTMVRLKAFSEYFGYREDEEGIHICETPAENQTIPTVVWEENLAGQAAKNLRVKDTRATLKAYHDYLVNTLTHRDYIDSAYFKKKDPKAQERCDQMHSKYAVFNNVALASGYGVCEDYAQLFKGMCQQAGIPCETVRGDVNRGFHTWNRVWLWGKWYHVDVTFDDPGPEPTLWHKYFLISAKEMAKNHTWTDSDYVKPTK